MSDWPMRSIGSLCDIVKGETGLASAIPGEYPLVTTGAERKTANAWQFDTEAVCIPLVSSTGHGKKTLNYVHYQEGKFALGTILAAVIPKDKNILSASYMHRYLQFYKDRKIVPLMRGAANVSLAVRDIAKIEIPVPPIEKQRSLILLFNKLYDFDSAFGDEAATQSAIIAKLRQAVLQEAIEGKLTVDWRKSNPVRKGDAEYDAVALLDKIKVEKQKLVVKGKIRKEKPLVPIKAEDVPFALPKGWVWTRLGEIGEIKGGKRVENGYKLQKTPTDHIYIRVSDMKNGTIDDSDLHYIDDKMYQKIKQYTISKDDLYMTIVGATIGKCGIVPDIFHNMNLTENAAKIHLHLTNKDYLFRLLSSPFCQMQFIDKTKQVGVQKMALNRFGTTIIPIPPLAEQQAIVLHIEKILAMINKLETQEKERIKQMEEVLQVALREVFEK
ncbi:hypothetical protein FACS1894109_00970 [Spirochaetia bacterium]|nr:hypothetical protein FACS1894109_00970 [Spirochaetia bacterium]